MSDDTSEEGTEKTPLSQNWTLQDSNTQDSLRVRLREKKKGKRLPCNVGRQKLQNIFNKLNAIFPLIRLVTLFFFLQFLTLIIIVFLNFFIWGLYSVALPSTAKDANKKETALTLIIVSTLMVLLLFTIVCSHLVTSLFYAAVDLWSKQHNPILIVWIRFLMAHEDPKKFYKYLHTFQKRKPPLRYRFWALVLKYVLVFGPLLYVLIFIGYDVDTFSRFLMTGLIMGMLYGLVWLTFHGLCKIKMMTNLGLKTGLERLGLISSSGGSISMKQKVWWIFCILGWLSFSLVPTFTMITYKAGAWRIIVTFFAIVLVYPAIIVGYYYNIYQHKKQNKFAVFTCLQIVTIIIVLIAIILLIALFQTTANQPCMRPEILTYGSAAPALSVSSTSPYAYQICGRQWFGLNIVDYALMALLSYDISDQTCYTIVEESLHKWFTNDTWAIVGSQQQGEILGYLHFYNSDRNLSIISVRGTIPTRATDVLQDLDLFNEIALLQASEYVFPLVNYWTDDMIQSFVYWCAFLEDFLLNDYENYNPLITYVRNTIHNNTYPGQIVLVGHSLGGAIAKIVGAKQNLTAIGFESPGLLYGSRKFGIDPEVVEQTVVNIVATNDIIPKVDKNCGLTQEIICPSKDPLVCHSMFTVICALTQSCDETLGTNSGDYEFC